MSANGPIVIQLQQAAYDQSTPASQLLLMALVVARKLKIADMVEWISSEQNGYGEKPLPDYRILEADIRFQYRQGFSSVVIQDPELARNLSKAGFSQSIRSLEDLVKRSEERKEELFVGRFRAEQAYAVQAIVGARLDGLPVQAIMSSDIRNILYVVRNIVLDWSLRLEAEGILGEGVRFSEEEKDKAAESTQIHINNFQGILGDVSGSQVSQSLKMIVSRGDIGALKDYIQHLGVSSKDVNVLEKALKEDPLPKEPGKFGPAVSAWIGEMVKKAASGALQLSLGTAGSLLANGITRYYGWP